MTVPLKCSLIVLLVAEMFAPQLIMAQPDDNMIYNPKPINPKSHVLWFNGHWSPANKNIFIIDKDSLKKGAGGTITIKRGGEIQVKTEGADEWNKKVDEALKSIDTWEKKLDDPASNTDPTSYHLNTLMK